MKAQFQQGVDFNYYSNAVDLAANCQILFVACALTDKMRHIVNREVMRWLFDLLTIGILGVGRIGSAIAKRAEAFSCTISYHSRTKKQGTNYNYYSNAVDLAANCQMLFVACALADETRHIVNREVISALGPKGVLVNIGRGALVDEPELVSALCQGRVGGSGLDVKENSKEDCLTRLPNKNKA